MPKMNETQAASGADLGSKVHIAATSSDAPEDRATALSPQDRSIVTIPLDNVHVGKRLRRVDPRRLKVITESIKEIGLQTPVAVTKDDAGNHHPVAGLNRFNPRRHRQVPLPQPDPIDQAECRAGVGLHSDDRGQ
jgi:hypothetical protein